MQQTESLHAPTEETINTDIESSVESEEDIKGKGDDLYEFKTARFGVWEVVYASNPNSVPSIAATALGIGSRFKCLLRLRSSNMSKLIDEYSGRYFIRLVKEMYNLAPRHFVICMVYELWASLEDSLSIYLTSRLLDSVRTYFV